MVREFEGKYGIILGGSSGLGYASALKLAQHGMNLIIFYRASRMQLPEIEERFSKIKEQNISLFTINTDATREDRLDSNIHQIKELLENQPIYLLLHSISKGNLKPMTGESVLSSGDFQQTIYSMGISLYSWVSRLQQEQLFAQPARVISFTSEGNTKPMIGYAAVSAAKATLEAINRNIALEFAPFNITANCIQAGVTDTESLKRIPMYDQLKSESLKRNPNQRLTMPEDVANAVYLLARKESQWMTGNVLKVDGGEFLQ
ncbi:short-chain dehydrogenase [Nonlabens arenilitoris]|uniref:Short-chain dehydrogenase n=1 Tax=Nonlabens arenilitoris TaxID=1217969 RepID=A0A2S7UD19_9FLAO|nr:SDR family oxidoreductase [Nonlabens arenilitoris]PQJ32848.1 short-chain dehydrogenase [Nonlabens arenilitoris]